MDRWETFHLAPDAAPDGALHRHFDDLVLRTRIAFVTDAGAYRAESVITFAPGSRAWAHSSFRAEPDGGHADVDRVGSGLDADTMPSYGEFLLLADLVGTGEAAVRYIRLTDSDPVDGADRATLERQQPETITPPGAAPMQAVRYGVVIEGDQVGTHWVRDGRVEMSDWGGAVSVRVDSADQALAGLPEDVAAFLRDGFGGLGARA